MNIRHWFLSHESSSLDKFSPDRVFTGERVIWLRYQRTKKRQNVLEFSYGKNHFVNQRKKMQIQR